MTLQSSGPISFSNIQTEFSGVNPISLTEYYGRASGIPASGQISVSQFYGKSSLRVQVPDLGVSGTGLTQRYLGFKFFAGNAVWTLIGQNPPPPQSFSNGSWLVSGVASGYDILVQTNQAFSTSNGSLAPDVWYNLGSDRAWWWLSPPFGTSATIFIRDASTLVQLASKASAWDWSP
jgi:hypothetical protein